MKNKISFLFTLSLGFASAALADVKVMVLDSPVSYQHSRISPYADLTSMSRYFFTDSTDRYASWKDLTDFYVSDFKMTFRSSVLPQLLDLLDRKGNSKLSARERREAQMELMKHVQEDPDWSSALRIIGNYVHGTHVAGLMVSGQDSNQFKIIAAPVFSKQGFEPFMADAFNISAGFSFRRPNAKKNIDEITKAIHEQGVKVVNMSFGSFWNGSIENTMTSELPLFQQNPDTVFVVAAGNDTVDLSPMVGPGGEVFPQTHLKNVLFVSALNEKGDLAQFSDYGVGVVQIAAPGTSIESASPDEKLLHLDGTSMAAPIVSNRVGQVRLQHPELSAPEAVQYLLDHETYVNGDLVSKVTDGRCLIMYNEPRAIRLLEQESIRELKQFVGDGSF